ncbi:hypothetical protein [Halodesulfovibrio marinisediminis]|uniref:Uncharacterized protein n=1 Tax=Halodesulfovibrio marinisediminis DSM 17456 TaxID=1121457 RepID=A0A1N6IJC3_9BACT|nr:hypothetical protein [Halodesulfovibrio marinisediminis]SIO32140.1 hypothetical protein SAMN02745161_2808 [Halodesulfovibrio marinisediminis DSM 17456]
MSIWISAWLLLIPSVVLAVTNCYWDAGRMQFSGDAVQQTLCLTPTVRTNGVVGGLEEGLPSTLDELVGREFDFSREAVEAYFVEHGLRDEELGGALNVRVSRARGENAFFFAIHDSDGPNFGTRTFTPDINISPHINDLRQFGRRWHVLIGRDGNSTTLIDFFQPLRSTYFEARDTGAKAKGRFLHVGLIQPVRSNAVDAIKTHDSLIPQPAYTRDQYRRLAQVYIAASSRAGRWLIPAYAAQLNQYGRAPVFMGGPKGFDLSAWAKELRNVYREIYSSR